MSEPTMVWLDTRDADPPHVDDPQKTAVLIKSLREGWNGPALIGYPWDGRIQLLSGSHRWAAARYLGMRIPVVLVRRPDVESAWGDLEAWAKVMR